MPREEAERRAVKFLDDLESRLEKVLGKVTRDESLVRGMGRTMLVHVPCLAGQLRHAEADVEHLVYVILDLSDVRRSLDRQGAYPDDALAAVQQLLEDRATTDETATALPPRTARLQAVHELAARDSDAGSAVVRAAAAALPRELGFLRKPLEAAALDVAPVFDGALSGKGGAMTFAAWDPALRTVLARMQAVADRKTDVVWTMTPSLLLLSTLYDPSLRESLASRGLDPQVLLADVATARERTGFSPDRLVDPPPGHVPSIGPALFATLLRAESYAADDATNVKLRHLLAALHDEPLLAPAVARLVR
ncbi:MAG: hypothetical protein JWP97_6600 [Labilithrix sp.]|nr:hypothetical protein [Labilithrix sp.]